MDGRPRRTRTVRDEHELGRWSRAVRPPDPRLRGLLYRDLVGFEQERAAFSSWLEPPQPPVTIYAVVSDPDGHHERARGGGAEIVRELADQPYGSREYSARDPEGNVWSFGTYDPYAGSG